MIKMKTVVISAMMLLIYLPAFSQDDTIPKTSGFISAGGGIALPVGSFSTTTGTGFGGYASIGHTFYVQGGVIINKWHMGFAIELGSYICKYAPEKYIANLQDTSTLQNPVYANSGSSTQYKGGYGLLGIFANLQIHRFTFIPRIMGGRFTTFFPEVIYSVSGTTKSNTPFSKTFDDLSTESYSLGLEAGVNASYTFSKHFAAYADAAYLHSTIAYGTIEQTTNIFVGNNCVVSLLNITAGISYHF